MKKHMYLRVLWPYVIGLIVLFFLEIKSGNLFDGLPIESILVFWLIMPIPFLLSIFFLIRNYRNFTKYQKIIFISISILMLTFIILSAFIFHEFIIQINLWARAI